MSNLKAIEPSSATGKIKQLFDSLQQKLGIVPNSFRIMANSPAVLNAYLGFNGALAEGSLSAKVREQIAVAVAQVNHCDYCLSAHSALGKLAGLSPDELSSARRADVQDPKTASALRFAVSVVRERGQVNSSELDTLRNAGFTDGEIAEIIAAVAINIFTNYFNHITDPEVDFPRISSGAAAQLKSPSGGFHHD
jgi:uncharacterized peroxidase-related enzyme